MTEETTLQSDKRLCKNEWNKKYYQEHRDKILECVKKYYQEHRDTVLERNKKYGRQYRDKVIIHKRKYRQKQRIAVLQKIVGEGNIIRCVNCGCDDIRILEVNHKNGDGTKERENINYHISKFYAFILNGERKIDDLDIRCRLCNILHYIELRYGQLQYSKIIWQKKEWV